MDEINEVLQEYGVKTEQVEEILKLVNELGVGTDEAYQISDEFLNNVLIFMRIVIKNTLNLTKIIFCDKIF